MRLARLAVLALVLVGCSKRMESRVAGLEDDQISTHEARLEELRSRSRAPNTSCAEQCELSTQTCEEAEALCGVVDRHPRRPDLGSRCARAREACGERTDTCTRCQTRG